MATTLDTYAPFDSGPGADTTEDTWRKFMRHVLATGVLANTSDQFLVFADSTGMQVKASPGECWIRGHWGESLSTKVLPIDAAHATQPRLDLVILRADFLLDRIELDVLKGVPHATTPVYRTLTQNTSMWEIAIGGVRVEAAVLTIAAAKVTDRRRRVGDAGGSAQYYQSVAQSVPTGTGVLTKVKFDTPTSTTGDVAVTGTGNTDFTVLRAGTYDISATTVVAPSLTGSLLFATIRDNVNNKRLATQNGVTFTSDSAAMSVSASQHFEIGDSISISVLQNTGGNHNLSVFEQATRISMTWVSDA